MFNDEDSLISAGLLGLFLFLALLVGFSCYDSHLQRQCRENLAKLEASRSAADIVQICK